MLSPFLRLVACAVVLAVAATVRGHDLIDAEATEKYLARADAALATIRGKAAADARARAHHDLGRMLDEIRELLNRDIATHGKVQGLPSNLLVSQLQARGFAFAPGANGRFTAPVAQYQEALRLQPDGQGGDTAYRLLCGRFYDSFDGDPLAAKLPLPVLQEQIRLAERLLQRSPPHPESEEIEFLLVAHEVLAARAVTDAKVARGHAERARRGAAEFARKHPDSMRRPAVEVLADALR